MKFEELANEYHLNSHFNNLIFIHYRNYHLNLQSLTFQCKDDNCWNDELIQWLHYHLPSACSITRDTYQTSNIQL